MGCRSPDNPGSLRKVGGQRGILKPTRPLPFRGFTQSRIPINFCIDTFASLAMSNRPIFKKRGTKINALPCLAGRPRFR